MTQLHSGMDHPGLKESKRRISMYYYWPTIKEDIDESKILDSNAELGETSLSYDGADTYIPP